jgi:exonuclease III
MTATPDVLKVLSWNVNHNSKSWNVVAALDADVVLLQEATLRGLSDGGDYQIVAPPSDDWKVQGGNGPAATAIVILNPDIKFREIPIRSHGVQVEEGIASSYPGQFSAIELSFGSQSLTLVSLYGVIEFGLADAAMHRAISDLTPLMVKETPMLIAGDMNLFRGHSLKSVYNSLPRFDSVFDRFVVLGFEFIGPTSNDGPLANCSCRLEACSHVATYRHHHNEQEPFQLDFAFCSVALSKRVLSCRVLDENRFWTASDHAPIEIVLSVESSKKASSNL